MSTWNIALNTHARLRAAPRMIAALAAWLLLAPAQAASVDLTGVEFSTLA